MTKALGHWVRRQLVNRNFALFLLGTSISATGYWFLLVALGWLVLELGDSTFLLGVANFAQMAPLFFLGILGGAAADRFDRRTIMVVGQLVAVASMVVLSVLASLGLLSIGPILACSVAFGLANAVLWPTWSVFIKDLVGAANLRQAVALNSARFNLTRVVGPVLAGVALESVGPVWCLWLAAITSLASVVTIFLLDLPPQQPREADGASLLAEVGQGLQYAWQAVPVRRLLAFTGVIGLVAMPFQTFLPSIARDTLHEGPQVLGLLTAAIGVGAMLGAVASGTSFAARQPLKSLLLLGIGVALGLVLLAGSQTLGLSLIALAVLGLATIGFLSTANASLQLAVPEALVGRVMGLWVVLNAGTQPLGSLIEGALAERWQLSSTFLIAGAVCAVAVAWMAYVSAERPTLRRATADAATRTGEGGS